jgi:hypothetical protein
MFDPWVCGEFVFRTMFPTVAAAAFTVTLVISPVRNPLAADAAHAVVRREHAGTISRIALSDALRHCTG